MASMKTAFTRSELTASSGRVLRTHIRRGAGPALVLVPGTWGNLRGWHPLIERLPARTALAVVELPWQGGGTLPPGELTIPALADDVLAAVDTLLLDRFVLGGISLGGMIAVEIAGRSVPGLLGVLPMEGWTHHTVRENAFDGIATTGLTPAQEEQSRTYRRRGQAHLSREDRARITAIWRHWNGWGALERSTVPILHIWGDRGRPRPDRTTLQIPDKPNIKLAWMAGASHSLLIQAPEALARVVLNFLAEVDG